MDQKENININIELLFHIFLLFVINYIFNFELWLHHQVFPNFSYIFIY